MDVRSFARAGRVAESATATWRASHIAIAIWVLAVAARLVLINQPYVDDWSWRQSDVAAIARNFYEGGFRFAYPQIDWAGDATGYVGTEFPILPFLAAICYKVAGIHEDRKSTRLNSSHVSISYAVFCLKKKTPCVP